MDSQKFPLASKAIGEVNSLFNFLGDKMPADLSYIHNRVADLIDGNTSLSPVEKDSVIATAILLVAPPFIFDEQDRFEKDYNPLVQSLVNEALGADRNSVPSTGNAQGAISVAIAMAEVALRQLKSGELAAGDRENFKVQFNSRPRDEEALLLSQLKAPALEAAFKKAVADVENELGLGGGAPAPKAKKNPKAPGL